MALSCSAFAFQVAVLGGFNALFRRTVPQSTCYLALLRYATLRGKPGTPFDIARQPCFGVLTVCEAREDAGAVDAFNHWRVGY